MVEEDNFEESFHSDEEYEKPSRFQIFWGLCKLVCCPPCPSSIVSKMAFLPPPSSYRIGLRQDATVMLSTQVHDSQTVLAPAVGRLIVAEIRTRKRNTIASYYLEMPNSEFSILFSHGNAVDIGYMLPYLEELSQNLQCSIFAYDYSGYGCSTGAVSEANLYADMEAAWDYLRAFHHVPADRIILYGQSIGTVPTVDLAARFLVGGVILHSPLMSGLRVLKNDVSHTWCFDPFPSIDKIDRIQSPVLIVHGTEDEVIHISHGHQLYERCANPVPPLWVLNGGHNDLESFPEFWTRLGLFVQQLKLSL